ncbi:hypothetical protein ElyMa_001456700 [Elysia marginata]|uniref:Uncharacterized protein n=1 Tax=Elysia marginata TaxID=1093978 RepID=A0AAV4J1E4_9GAST|nr:hypothetical protein ElyMa_001456700 [Elysia marginata]
MQLTKPFIKLKGTLIKDVDSFIYLGSVVDLQSGTDADGKITIDKARAAVDRNAGWAVAGGHCPNRGLVQALSPERLAAPAAPTNWELPRLDIKMEHAT